MDSVLPIGDAIDLNDPAGAWMVESGHVDCFVVEPNTIGEIGRRRPLFTVPDGAVLIGVDPGAGALRLSAVPSLGARWHRLTMPADAAQLEGWAERLIRATILPAPDLPDRRDAPAEIALAAGERLALARRPIAIRVNSGAVRIGGRVDWATGDGPLLALDPLWIESADGASLTLAPQYDGAALAGLHRAFLGAVEAQLADELAGERERMRLRSLRETDAIARGLSQLAGAAARGVSTAAFGGLATDPVSAALAPVLRMLGEAPLTGVVQPTVERALAARGLRHRRILFRPGWQADSAEPVVGFLGEARTPVALLPAKTWRVVGADIDQPLDAAIEEALQLDGVQVYRALPFGATRFGAFLRLGVRGGARDFSRVLALGIGASIAGLAVPAAVGTIFDTVVPNADVGGLVTMIVVLVVAAFVSGAFAVANAIALLRVESRFEINGSPALMDRLLTLPATFFRANTVGDLVDRLLGIQHARALVGASLSQLVFGTLLALASLILLLSYSWVVGLVALLLAAVVAGINVAISRAQLRLSRVAIAEHGRLGGFVLQLITGVAKLRGAAAERRAMAQWSTRFATVVGRTSSVRRWGAIQLMIDDSLPLITIAAMYATIQGGGLQLTTGGVIAVTAAFAQLMGALLAMARALNLVAHAAPLIERARPLLETPPETRTDAEPIGRLEGEIGLRNVSFRYGDTGPLVLDNLSLDIPAGSFAAFVGPSGSGKSTVLRLLLGFETPGAGEVLFDGRTAERIDPGSLRRQIGVVLQNGQIFAGSILENILGPASLDIADAWAAARMVGLDGDIEDMPMGMHTVLLDGGGTISGGQRQRILIARALVHRPRILLFDEATSALDNRTQAIVTETLTRLSITRVVIAHRLSTIEDVDRVFVIQAGRLVQQGGYRELLDQPGAFAELARRQISE